MMALTIPLLRVALLVLLLGSVLAQGLVPVIAFHEASTWPEIAHLAVPYAVAAILFIACGQVAVLALWRLLALVRGGAIFTRGALRWLDVITACATLGTVLGAGVLGHLVFIVGARHLVLTLGLGGCLVGGLALALLVVVTRGVLASAIVGRAELSGTTG